MDLSQDKVNLIEKAIKTNRKFTSNEDLYDDFFNETYKRSLAIVNSINSEAALESYLRKIATTSIINVLKDSGRLRRTREGFIPTKEVSLDVPFEKNDEINYSNIKISYQSIQIEEGPEDLAIKKEIITRVSDIISNIENLEPEQQYMSLYNMRYGQGMTQAEIADRIGLSQSEVSKRLFKLMDKVKQLLN